MLVAWVQKPFSQLNVGSRPSESIAEVRGKHLRLIYVGGKGDWPFLRKVLRMGWFACCFTMFLMKVSFISWLQAYSLQSGFTSIRKCHLCSSKVGGAKQYIYIL